MADAISAVPCYWTPSGWAMPSETGGCTCQPCTEAGVPLSPKAVYRWERRIKRILRKQGIEYGDDE